jgi:glutathione synthase/RimK-type ligase-like ATP-grasp enzyme
LTPAPKGDAAASGHRRARVAFVTSRALAALTEDDRLAVAPLARAGVDVTATVWNDPGVNWGAFDLVIMRSPWDYFLQPTEFFAWIDRREAEGAPLLNPAGVMRVNLDKRYLMEFAARGLPVIETEWLPRGATLDLPALLARRGWARAVLKPAVSGGGWRTVLTDPERPEEDAALAREILASGGLLVQRFVDEVRSAGEWSLVYFERRFHHAVVKRPRAGDFRVQSDHGGSVTTDTPSAEVLAEAQRVLDAVAGPLLYARVDGIEVAGRFELMELELVEPALFLGAAPNAVEAFTRAIRTRLNA